MQLVDTLKKKELKTFLLELDKQNQQLKSDLKVKTLPYMKFNYVSAICRHLTKYSDIVGWTWDELSEVFLSITNQIDEIREIIRKNEMDNIEKKH